MGSGSIYRSDAARAAIEELYDRARERLPFVTESRMVPTRFGETHVLVAGPLDGTPVVALQGGNVVNPLTLAWLTPLVDIVPHLCAGHDRATGKDRRRPRFGERFEPRRLDDRRPRRPRPAVGVVHRRILWRGRPAPTGRGRAGTDRSSGACRPGRPHGRSGPVDAVARRRLPVVPGPASPGDRRCHRPAAGRPGSGSHDGRVDGPRLRRHRARYRDAEERDAGGARRPDRAGHGIRRRARPAVPARSSAPARERPVPRPSSPLSSSQDATTSSASRVPRGSASAFDRS